MLTIAHPVNGASITNALEFAIQLIQINQMSIASKVFVNTYSFSTHTHSPTRR